MLNIPNQLNGYEVHRAYVGHAFGVIMASMNRASESEKWVVATITDSSLIYGEWDNGYYTPVFLQAAQRFYERVNAIDYDIFPQLTS